MLPIESSKMSELHQLFALLTIAVVAGVGDARSPQQVVGGTEAALGEFPYQVALRLRGNHMCGGSIIGKRYIITAAHCVVGIARPPYTELRIATGTISITGGQIHTIKSIVSHPHYNSAQSASSPNDIAIIELAADIKFDKHQDKVKLPTSAAKSGLNAIATGWGLENGRGRKLPDRLMKVTLKTLEPVECQKSARIFTIHPRQICSISPPGRGVCNGDSGGPLVHNGELIGLVSYGMPCGLGIPDVYTGVYHYLDWIKSIIGSS